MKQSFSPCGGISVDYIKNEKRYDMPVQHYHDAFEIYLQLDGKRYLYFNDACYDLKKGDAVFLRPFDIHHMESRDSDYYERYVLDFGAEDLKQILSSEEIGMLLDDMPSCVVKLDSGSVERARAYFEDAARAAAGGFLANKTMCFSAVKLALLIKGQAGDSAGAEFPDVRGAQSEIIESIHYINNNYAKPINLDTMADFAHMSKYHFCRVFHRTTGATLLEYLCNVRLTKVHKLLAGTDLTLGEIAARTGFASTANMTYTFRKVYHISPSEFRRRIKKDALPLGDKPAARNGN